MIQLGPIKASSIKLPVGDLRMTTVGKRGVLVTLMTSRKSGMVSVMLTRSGCPLRSKLWRRPNHERRLRA